MKKLLLALALVFSLSTQAFATTQAIVPDFDNGDSMLFQAYDPTTHDFVPFAQLTTNHPPTFDIFSNTTFGGQSLASKLDGYAAASDMVSMNSRVSALEGVTPFSGQYADLTGKPSIPTTFDGLTDGTTNKAFTATLLSKLNGVAAGATANSSDAVLENRANPYRHAGDQHRIRPSVGARCKAGFYNGGRSYCERRDRRGDKCFDIASHQL